MKVTIDVDDKTWWSAATEADRKGTTVSQLASDLLTATFNKQAMFHKAVTLLHSRGYNDGEIAVALRKTRAQIALVRRHLNLQPNKPSNKKEKH